MLHVLMFSHFNLKPYDSAINLTKIACVEKQLFHNCYQQYLSDAMVTLKLTSSIASVKVNT